jgi:hypothetical protein
MAITKEDITNLKNDIQNLHRDLKEAMDHLEYHLGVKRMDENDLDKMSKHLADVDKHMATLIAHANSLGEKHS